MTMTKNMKRALAGLMLSAFAAVNAAPALAQDTLPGAPASAQDVLMYSSGTYLAYVASPSGAVNDESDNGLKMLANMLTQKTSIAPKGVVSIDLENDSLDKISCFPFIYYPVTPETPALSAQARAKLQKYLDNGGMLMIDTKDYGAVTTAPRDLSAIMGRLNLRPLVPLPQDHTLTRSFYLSHLPGITADGTIWVEQPGAKGSELVTSVIVGGRNWAGAWASAATGQGTSRDQELALRSGINFVMHALTGNYKADQTFMPSIIERLGK